MIANEMVVFATAAVSIIAAVLVVVGPIVRARMELWLNQRYQEFMDSLPETTQRILLEVVRIVVYAVEQTYNDMGVEEQAKGKLKIAEEKVEAWLKLHGIELELDRIREAIEHIVFEMNKEIEI